MGDMADMILDQGWPDDGGEFFFDEVTNPEGVSCKYCFQAPLFWCMTEKGWRLETKKGVIHFCGEYRKEKPNENKRKSNNSI